MRFPHIAARIFDTPLLIARPKAQAILGALSSRMGFEISGAVKIEGPPQQIYDEEGEAAPAPFPGYSIEGGVARLPIIGPLVHRTIGMEAMSGGPTSYAEISAAFADALANGNVQAILLEIDSPGGEASGAFDLADEIYAARGIKPIVAIAADCAASAAYLIGSAADRLIVSQNGDVGSVGVAWVHVDYSAQNKMMGEAVTYLFAGDHKMEGWPDFPISAGARERFQANIDQTYGVFVEKVARHRNIDASAVIASKADTYRGPKAISIGFADAIGTVRATLNSLAEAPPPAIVTGAEQAAVAAQQMEHVMTTKPTAPAAAEVAGQATAPAQQIDVEQVSREAAHKATGAAISGERARIAAILGSEDAKGREALANHLAMQTDLSAEGAAAILKAAPKQETVAPKPPNKLEAAMNNQPNPSVGADTEANGDKDIEQAAHASVLEFRGLQKRSA